MYTFAVILGIIAAVGFLVAIIAFIAGDSEGVAVGAFVAFIFGVAFLIVAVTYNDDLNQARESREISALIDQTYHVPAHVDGRHDTASFDYQGAHCVLRYVSNALHQWELTHPICAKEVSINP